MAVTFKIGGKQIIIIHIGHDSRIATKRWPEKLHGILKYRVVVGKMIDFPVQEYSFSDTRWIVIVSPAFDKITNEIAHCYLTTAVREIYMSQVIQMK